MYESSAESYFPYLWCWSTNASQTLLLSPHSALNPPSLPPRAFSSYFLADGWLRDDRRSVCEHLWGHTPCGGMFGGNGCKRMVCRKCARFDHTTFFSQPTDWFGFIKFGQSSLGWPTVQRQTTLSGCQMLQFLPAVQANHTPFPCISVLSGTIHFIAEIKVCCVRLSLVIGEVGGG